MNVFLETKYAGRGGKSCSKKVKGLSKKRHVLLQFYLTKFVLGFPSLAFHFAELVLFSSSPNEFFRVYRFNMGLPSIFNGASCIPFPIGLDLTPFTINPSSVSRSSKRKRKGFSSGPSKVTQIS